MLNLRARQYEPAQGRFSQRDSLKGWAASPRSMNAYLYCLNDAINFFDASGAAMMAVNMTDGGGGRKSDTSPSSFFRKAGQTIKTAVTQAVSSAAAASEATQQSALTQAQVSSILKESRNPANVWEKVRSNRAQAQATTPTVSRNSFLRSTKTFACMAQEEYDTENHKWSLRSVPGKEDNNVNVFPSNASPPLPTPNSSSNPQYKIIQAPSPNYHPDEPLTEDSRWGIVSFGIMALAEAGGAVSASLGVTIDASGNGIVPQVSLGVGGGTLGVSAGPYLLVCDAPSLEAFTQSIAYSIGGSFAMAGVDKIILMNESKNETYTGYIISVPRPIVSVPPLFEWHSLVSWTFDLPSSN